MSVDVYCVSDFDTQMSAIKLLCEYRAIMLSDLEKCAQIDFCLSRLSLTIDNAEINSKCLKFDLK